MAKQPTELEEIGPLYASLMEEIKRRVDVIQPLDFKKIEAWVTKIAKLLNHHQIQISQPDKQLWVLMHDKDDGKVKWAVMKRVN